MKRESASSICKWAALSLIALAMTCAPGIKYVVVSPQETTRTFNSTFDVTWQKLLLVLGELHVPIVTTDRASGLVMSDHVEFQAHSAFGESMLQISGLEEKARLGRYKLNVLVTPKGAATEVRINCHMEKFVQPCMAPTYSWVYQPSNGYIESRVFRRLSRELR